ncbi:MAG: N-acetyltransferase [Endomicrobiales bacterium]|nr:N-acetyltransferase [Endomicrobiales bacterium]
MRIRQAKVSDVGRIHELINEHAAQGKLLPRPLSELYEKIQMFAVAEEKDRVIACGALQVSWEDLAEVRSLVVSKERQGKGIGSKIVRHLELQAKRLGIGRVFALSFRPGFFKTIGYRVVKRETLPHKVWRDCVRCPLFPDCGETALMKRIAGR